jgi:hypothetical protein
MRRGGAREVWRAGPCGEAQARQAGAGHGGSCRGGRRGAGAQSVEGHGGSVSRVDWLGPGDRLTGPSLKMMNSGVIYIYILWFNNIQYIQRYIIYKGFSFKSIYIYILVSHFLLGDHHPK